MKPKEPKLWKYPRLYWTIAPHQVELIIIYPDGRRPDRTHSSPYEGYFGENYSPCWYWGSEDTLYTAAKQRDRMMRYAKAHGFKRVFIGEIK